MIRYNITQNTLIVKYSHNMSQRIQVFNKFNSLSVIPFHCMKNPPVLDDVLLLTFLWRAPQAFQDFIVSGGLLQAHGLAARKLHTARVSNVGSKLLIPGFQQLVLAAEFADRPVVGRFHAVIQREQILQTVSSEYLYLHKLTNFSIKHCQE